MIQEALMAFQEKSAWIMSVALLLAGLSYFYLVAAIGAELGEMAPPLLPLIIVYTVCLVALSVVGHIVIAVLAPKEANSPPDERDRQIVNRAGHYSSYVLVSGVVMSLGLYVVSHDGNLLFYAAFTSLMIAQVLEYVFQILLYRTSI